MNTTYRYIQPPHSLYTLQKWELLNDKRKKMATQEATDYYYEKAKKDFMIGFYDQPFPSAMVIELDDFERVCNKSYKNGYSDAAEELKNRNKFF